MTLIRICALAFLTVGALVAGSLGAAPAYAQSKMWAIDTNTCTSDGTRCIKGIVKQGPPFATLQECEKKKQALEREYHQANMKVMFIRCVQLR